MAKKRVVLYLNKAQSDILEKNIAKAHWDTGSAYIGYLLAKEEGLIEDNRKRPAGRPRKEEETLEEYTEPDYSDDLPKTINHYGNMIGKREMADIDARTRAHNSAHFSM